MFTLLDPIELICSLYECKSCFDFLELWNSLCTLHEHKLIPDNVWSIFYRYADSLHFDNELNRVVREYDLRDLAF